MSDPLSRLAAYLGVIERYQDQTDSWHDTSPETKAAIVAGMGFDTSNASALTAAHDALRAEDGARDLPEWMVTVANAPGPVVAAPWRLTLENGAQSEGQGALPVLPLGIHRLVVGDYITWLLSAPVSLPPAPKSWGLTMPLYGLRTAAQGGVGDYHDLGGLVRDLAGLGVGFLGINPIHAGFPTDPMAFSPYSPSSRRRFSILHIAADAKADDHGPLIDYAAVLSAQNRALRAEYAAFQGDSTFDAYCLAEGESLRRFALHQALSDQYGAYWPDWPVAFHTPESADVAAFAGENADTLRYHQWLQWRAEHQLGQVCEKAGAMALGLYLDLAVGTHPKGAETWGDPDLFAPGCSLGAPPDGFSPGGQRWNLAPMRPRHLARTGFAALAEILRAQLRYARVLRIDHILGFERAFWVPENAPGAYVTMPKAALLAVARIEAARVGAVIIGEDLGNIPKGLQSDLAESNILGCRVAMFEQKWQSDTPEFKPAADYDTRVLTSFASHDLPTYRGWRRGSDIGWRAKLGGLDCAAQTAAMTERAAEVKAFETTVGGHGVDQVNGFLAATPSRLVAVQAEDALGLIEQPNLPGTVYDHPNWRRRLGISPQDLPKHPGVIKAAQTMKTAGR
ncbi:4-alpha-glucanotransferase [Oceaniglobus ichthyenteri]|uniref:4-alpha-glucanotransferase n=1 Tax=Oceaniglobus ichthyenteri TaxID=2136177 RepID=UPI000D3638CA|nr:4-alpha-glucanotransferase [Oceaniglobus ichthyenteri]